MITYSIQAMSIDPANMDFDMVIGVGVFGFKSEQCAKSLVNDPLC